MTKQTINIVLIVIFSIISIGEVFSQATIKKEVEVVQPYQPSVADAKKLNVLPIINDSTTVKPSFQYNVVPVMINTEYEVSQINAAKMLNMPLSKLYNGYLILGLGNYQTPMAELYLNTLRSRKYSAGAKLDYQSSSGAITLDNNQSVFAGYSNASATVFGKKFIGESCIFAEGGVRSNTVYDYGSNPQIDTILQKGNIRQNYFLADIKAGIQSFHSDSSRLNYHGDIKYDYFQDRFNHVENDLNLNAKFSQLYANKLFDLDLSFDQLHRDKTLDSTGAVNSLLVIYPSVCFSNEEYRLKLGLNITFEDQMNTVSLRLYPMADFQFVVVKNILLPFIGIYGKDINHSYQNIATENPFILPDLLVKNSNDRLSLYGGIKGSLVSKVSYNLKFDYSQFTNQYFYVNDAATVLQNHFNVVYDNANQLTLTLDASYDFSTELSFAAKINIYQYQMFQQQYAWQKPKSDATFSAKYNLGNKILVNFDILELGKRYAKIYSRDFPYIPDGNYKVMPSVLDFNLGAEYRYTKILSFWLHLNNFTASKYYVWNQYPSQRFNLMAGLSYSL